uniref:NADH-ubiquinone oxidoreductase chain 6 n=1 Tax=Micrasema sp. XG-2021 TaxID=2996737 RepID=A0A9E8LPR6_9NEOP|nr:NADH dehydrogenase subunit 6 [Micrasema sp. XG-2021]
MKIMYLLMILFTLINTKILQMSHPLLITILLVMQTSLITTMIGMISQTFWMSYIMFLTFIGGLLVLFIYVSSLTSNKILNFNKNYLMIMITFMFCIMIFPLNKNFINLEMIKFMNFSFFTNLENNLFLSNFYNMNEMYMTIMMMSYLLMVLIITIKIINLKHNPMRIKM